MSNWIKIEDQRPEHESKVIYYFKHVGRHRGEYLRVPLDAEFFGTDENGEPYMSDLFYSKKGFLSDDVTHWMYDEGQEMPDAPVI